MKAKIILYSIGVLYFTPASAEEKHSSRDHCVLDICFDKPETLRKAILQKQFGKTKDQKEVYSQKGNCYRLKDSKGQSSYAYLFYEKKGKEWTLSKLQLSKDAICRHPLEVLRESVNKDGISLYSSAEEVLNLYGNPHKKRTPDEDEKKFYGREWEGSDKMVFKYVSEDEVVSEVYISKGKVVGFEISNEADQ